MSLHGLHTQFETELDEWIRIFEELGTSKSLTSSSDFLLDDECLLEGMLSRIWQTWCEFCRSIVIESCMGAVTLSGLSYPALASATTVDFVSMAAIRAKNNQTPTWRGTNSVLRKEPTWGDTDVLLDIALALAPANVLSLTGMITLADAGSKIIQSVRNACAHDNAQTRANLFGLSSPYTTFPVTHPVQSLFWVHTSSSQYLLIQALDALRDAATHVVM